MWYWSWALCVRFLKLIVIDVDLRAALYLSKVVKVLRDCHGFCNESQSGPRQQTMKLNCRSDLASPFICLACDHCLRGSVWCFQPEVKIYQFIAGFEIWALSECNWWVCCCPCVWKFDSSDVHREMIANNGVRGDCIHEYVHLATSLSTVTWTDLW